MKTKILKWYLTVKWPTLILDWSIRFASTWTEPLKRTYVKETLMKATIVEAWEFPSKQNWLRSKIWSSTTLTSFCTSGKGSTFKSSLSEMSTNGVNFKFQTLMSNFLVISRNLMKTIHWYSSMLKGSNSIRLMKKFPRSVIIWVS